MIMILSVDNSDFLLTHFVFQALVLIMGDQYDALNAPLDCKVYVGGLRKYFLT